MLKKFTTPALLGIAVIVIITWYVMDSRSTANAPEKTSATACPSSFKPTMAAEPYYTGNLFDAHVHLPTPLRAVSDVSYELGLPTPLWDEKLSPDFLACLLEKEGTSGLFGFHLFTKFSVSAEVAIAKEMQKKHPNTFIHFVMPALINESVNPDISMIKNAIKDNPGLFRGIGEIKMYDGKNPDNPYVRALLDIAREYDLLVMIHPFKHHRAALEKMVSQYPDVNFLIHGIIEEEGDASTKEKITWLDQFMTINKNVYYSIDPALPIYGWVEKHYGMAVSKEELLPHLKAIFNQELTHDLSLYKKIIEKHPNNFIHGTDRWHKPHFDEKISSLLEEYNRAFIGRLDTSIQENFAHTNAEKLK